MSLFPNQFLLNIFACGLMLSCPLHLVNAAAETQKKETQPQLKWQTYTYQGSGFAVDFPQKPEQLQQTIDVPKSDLKIQYETYLSEPSDVMVFVVSVWNYPAEIDMSKPEVNLQDGFKGMLSALPGSEVLNMKMSTQEGFKDLEFLVKNEDIFFQGKLILVYNTLYQVFTVYKGSEEMTENYNHFVDSFKLIKPEQHKVAPQSTNATKMNV
jgi:hypothetical protein